MRRYLVFAYDSYEPNGGWGDFEGAFSTLAQAAAKADELNAYRDFTQVVDLEALEVVAKAVSYRP